MEGFPDQNRRELLKASIAGAMALASLPLEALAAAPSNSGMQPGSTLHEIIRMYGGEFGPTGEEA